MKSAYILILITVQLVAGINLYGQDSESVPNPEQVLNQAEEPFEETEITDEAGVGFVAGDSNLDGRFDSQDLTAVFESGKYENPSSGPADWTEGDWNNDSEFNSSDIVKAFQENQYEAPYYRPRPKDVPEPYGLSLVGMGMVFLLMAYIIVRQKPERDAEAAA